MLPRGAVLHTSRGDITLRLFPDEARAAAAPSWRGLSGGGQARRGAPVCMPRHAPRDPARARGSQRGDEEGGPRCPPCPLTRAGGARSARARWRTSRRTRATGTTTTSSSTASSRASWCRPATRSARPGALGPGSLQSAALCLEALLAAAGTSVAVQLRAASLERELARLCAHPVCGWRVQARARPSMTRALLSGRRAARCWKRAQPVAARAARRGGGAEGGAPCGTQATARAGRASGAASLRTSSAATCATTGRSPCPWPTPARAPTAASAPGRPHRPLAAAVQCAGCCVRPGLPTA